MVSAIKALFLHRQGCLAPPADAVVRVSLLKGRSLYPAAVLDKKSIKKIITFLVKLGPEITMAGLEYFLPSHLATRTRLQLWANAPRGSNKAQTSWQKQAFSPAGGGQAWGMWSLRRCCCAVLLP